MPQSKSRPPQHQPWESGWVPDTSRVPGTRRLWLAGVLAAATVVTCLTAVVLTEQHTDAKSPPKNGPETADPTGPGLISYASATPSGAETSSPGPGGEIGTPSSRPSDTTAPDPQGSAGAPHADPSKSPGPHPPSSDDKPSATWRSIRSVNYPDRYWHVNGSYVGLDRVSSASDRQDATFRLVNGLADASCYSFATSDGTYLRHRDFVLRAERDNASALFKRDATFCPRNSSVSGAVMLESVNFPGRFLRHKNFKLRLDPYQYSGLYESDAAFRLVPGLA